MMHSSLSAIRFLLVLTLACGVAACETSPFEAEAVDALATNLTFDKKTPDHVGQGAQLAQLRSATAMYQQLDRAVADGYGLLPGEAGECVESPDGGMGYHYVNLAYAGPADALDIEKPQALLYEPMKNGRKRLVGAEYIVFWGPGESEDDPVKGPQPSLFGQQFHEASHVGPYGAWTLHVWVWRNNPSGMFADFNPNVSCAFAS
jgi:hypothetical protein